MNNMTRSPGRHVPCEACPLRPLPALREFTPEELAFLRVFKTGEIKLRLGSTVLQEGEMNTHLYTVLSGWAFRYKTLPDGRRQILNFALPADFLGLQGSVMKEMQHSVEALTDMVLCVFPRDKLWELYSHHPSLAFDVTWLAAREEQMLDDHLLSVGRRSALERTAYILAHLFDRAREVGLAGEDRAQFPITQQHLADALGMSLVHMNKTLRRLTNEGLIRWSGRTFEILDRERLFACAGLERMEPLPRPFI
jgi:CRP/FNR family transcriptional regulator, anaerobic regulatory protein